MLEAVKITTKWNDMQLQKRLYLEADLPNEIIPEALFYGRNQLYNSIVMRELKSRIKRLREIYDEYLPMKKNEILCISRN